MSYSYQGVNSEESPDRVFAAALFVLKPKRLKLEEEKARRGGQTFNRETATYDKVYYEDIDYLKDYETEFSAIVYQDTLTSDPEILSGPTVSIRPLADLGASVSVMPFSTYTNLGLGKLAPTKFIVELADRTMKHPKGISEDVLVGIDKFVFPVDFIVLDMPEDIKTPLILGRPLLSTTHAKIDVSLDPLYRDYIKLNDLNEPLELKRHQVDDLVPTIKEGEVVDEPMIDIVKTSVYEISLDVLDDTLVIVSTHDELKGISHPYQKLKGFYKEVLNLGSEYIKNEKVEEWLTRGHCLPGDNPECYFSMFIESVFRDSGYGVLTIWTLSSLYLSAFKHYCQIIHMAYS
ncbi:putative reverse transcriptase domain-containing protein [Tanacetum coccineum]|uniref:Reverse transcriptase domain-containing protein n=1 Tax=Tanacetum coccineum TaxID=301880 RepID=A0ABQ4ZKK7_9ASTR